MEGEKGRGKLRWRGWKDEERGREGGRREGGQREREYRVQQRREGIIQLGTHVAHLQVLVELIQYQTHGSCEVGGIGGLIERGGKVT